jgi:hypothetical protein
MDKQTSQGDRQGLGIYYVPITLTVRIRPDRNVRIVSKPKTRLGFLDAAGERSVDRLQATRP